MIHAQEIQNKINELGKESDDTNENTHTQVIGFSMPDELDYYEDDDEEEEEEDD